jgi:hypothetical protein
MQTKKLITIFLSFITFCLILISCHKDPSGPELFLIKVDSIHVPNTILSNTPFDIDFFGTIGSNGCHKFESFQTSVNNTDFMIEAWGSRDNKNGVCPTVMVYLTGYKLIVTISTSGNYTLKIKQPDNTFLSKEITVK